MPITTFTVDAMDKQDIEFVRAALPSGRTVFYDFPDRYAVLLLTRYLQQGEAAVSELKKSHLAPLLNRPLVKQVLADTGRATLVASDFRDAWPDRVDGYRLTLDIWPGSSDKPQRAWHQVTRLGHSLVLQLNLPASHKRALARNIDNWQRYTNEAFHPVAPPDELTLAWARIDLDLNRSEALIEEIQSDWIRDVKYYAESKWIDKKEAWQNYYEHYLKPTAGNWPRTILTATLWFLLEEIGINTVFFHTHEAGMRLKNIRYGAPPRSVYTDLPKSFCFRTTFNGPAFLRDSRDKHVRALFTDPETKWYVHHFH